MLLSERHVVESATRNRDVQVAHDATQSNKSLLYCLSRIIFIIFGLRDRPSSNYARRGSRQNERTLALQFMRLRTIVPTLITLYGDLTS